MVHSLTLPPLNELLTSATNRYPRTPFPFRKDLDNFGLTVSGSAETSDGAMSYRASSGSSGPEIFAMSPVANHALTAAGSQELTTIGAHPVVPIYPFPHDSFSYDLNGAMPGSSNVVQEYNGGNGPVQWNPISFVPNSLDQFKNIEHTHFTSVNSNEGLNLLQDASHQNASQALIDAPLVHGHHGNVTHGSDGNDNKSSIDSDSESDADSDNQVSGDVNSQAMSKQFCDHCNGQIDFAAMNNAPTASLLPSPILKRSLSPGTEESRKRPRSLPRLDTVAARSDNPSPISPARAYTRIMAERWTCSGVMYKVKWADSWVHESKLGNIDNMRVHQVVRYGRYWDVRSPA